MNLSDLNLISTLPELVLLSGLMMVLLADLWISDQKRCITHWLSITVIALAIAAQAYIWTPISTTSFNGMFITDGLSQLAKVVMYSGLIVILIYSKEYNQNRDIFKGEFYTLSLFALLGMSVMVSAGHFLIAYIGLEILSLALYAMIALRRDSKLSSEAALKYFVLGALASGLLLYGISMIYGATGSLEFAKVLAITFNSQHNEWLLKLGLVFIVVAIAFKIGAVPFHMWVPDVYQGAPTSVAALVGTLPKIAAVVFAFRILVMALAQSFADWADMLAILAVASLVVGNLAAIMQTNIKRMLAYSTVSHMGFILLALMSGLMGFNAAVYYAITYVIMSLVAFGVLMKLSSQHIECENIAGLAGLNQKQPWLAFLMLLSMFSMAGIPPLMGFYAKLSVIRELVSQGYVWISAFAVIMSLIGAFYYLRVVKTMYFDGSDLVAQAPHKTSFIFKIVLTLNALLLLLWGIMPQTLMDWCSIALASTL